MSPKTAAREIMEKSFENEALDKNIRLSLVHHVLHDSCRLLISNIDKASIEESREDIFESLVIAVTNHIKEVERAIEISGKHEIDFASSKALKAIAKIANEING